MGAANHSGVDSIQSLLSAETNQKRNINKIADRPDVARDIAAFRAGVARAGSVYHLLSDPMVMKVLLRANGLGDQEPYSALARNALMSDLSDTESLANRLTDTRWKAVASTYQFAAAGMDVLRNSKVLDTLSNAYAEVTWRKSLDQTTPGLSDALTFREQAKSVTSDLQILGDPILRRVVTTALGLPLEIALQSVETQQKAVASRLDIKKLQDPKFVEDFIKRYLLSAAIRANTDLAITGNLAFSHISSSLVI